MKNLSQTFVAERSAPVDVGPGREAHAEAEKIGFHASRVFLNFPVHMVASPYPQGSKLYESWLNGFRLGKF